jgi:hypothetical protein
VPRYVVYTNWSSVVVPLRPVLQLTPRRAGVSCGFNKTCCGTIVVGAHSGDEGSGWFVWR